MLLFVFNFFRTLIIILVIYFIARWIMRITSPQETQKKSTTNRKEGETTIRFNKKGEKIVDKEEGEYVNFEEMD